ncbi:MAG TPA: hypothetical protein VE954_14075 [Oligoflexus sp.]|uniref:hypothetical protein n=1 Tax=Oligoflexus sp. TaxID=1971216 RepID=UPI002D360E1E|nr:hypothetical protein [Oligoflexus sp.]HYX34227.1 hypothetical protein [Oligoflexus sp.]
MQNSALTLCFWTGAHVWAQTLPTSARSEFNRQSQEAGVWAGASLRIGDMNLFEVSGEAAYFSEPNEILSVRVSRLSANELWYGYRLDSVDNTTHLEVSGTAISVNWKRFLADSFYLRAGLEHFNLKGEYFIASESENVRLHVGDMSRQNALFALGNQWQWESFTLGCDWAGASYPIAYRYASRRDEIESNTVNKFAKSGETTYFHLLHFYLGRTF